MSSLSRKLSGQAFLGKQISATQEVMTFTSLFAAAAAFRLVRRGASAYLETSNKLPVTCFCKYKQLFKRICTHHINIQKTVLSGVYCTHTFGVEEYRDRMKGRIMGREGQSGKSRRDRKLGRRN